MNTIGTRLKEERERLGMSQTAFGEAGGVKKNAQINYERDERKPDAGYLSAIAAMGADVLYIVTGQRSVAAVPVANRREYALLDNYRACEEEDKRAIERVALSAARTEPVARTEVKKSG